MRIAAAAAPAGGGEENKEKNGQWLTGATGEIETPPAPLLSESSVVALLVRNHDSSHRAWAFATAAGGRSAPRCLAWSFASRSSNTSQVLENPRSAPWPLQSAAATVASPSIRSSPCSDNGLPPHVTPLVGPFAGLPGRREGPPRGRACAGRRSPLPSWTHGDKPEQIWRS